MEAKSFLSIQAIKKYALEMFTGLATMHQIGVVHRDLKPENVLLKDDCVRIADLGSAKMIDHRFYLNTPYVVSRYYRAPELLLASNRYDAAVDVWSAACIIFELIA